MDIIIIGAGIGGLCLAQGLKKNKIDFKLFERNAGGADWLDGYRIHIRPMGSYAIHQCLTEPLWKKFIDASGDNADGFGFLSEDLEQLVHIEEDLMVGKDVLPQLYQYSINRKDLRTVLLQGLENNIVYERTFKRYFQLPNGRVEVTFDDGFSAQCDLLIAADGSNSKIRQLFLPNARRVETDAVAIGGKTMLTLESRQWIPAFISRRMNVVMPSDKYFFFSAIHDRSRKDPKSKDNYILWSFIGNKREFAGVHEASDLKDFVLKKMEKWHPLYKRLVDEGVNLLLLHMKTMQPVNAWPTSNITLLGDAIHNMTPLQGMGANTALQDAAMLAARLTEVVHQGRDRKSAIAEYEKHMLKTGFDAVALSMKYTVQAIGENKFKRAMSRNWFRLCRKVPLLKQMSFGNHWKTSLN